MMSEKNKTRHAHLSHACEKLLPIQMVWEVLGKERAKAITTYTKLKLYYIAIHETTHENLLPFLHDDIYAS